MYQMVMVLAMVDLNPHIMIDIYAMLLRIFTNIADFIILLPLILIFINRQYLTKELKVLSIYLLLIFVRNFIGLVYNFLYLKYNYYVNTLFYYNLTNIVGFYLIAYIYILLLKDVFFKNIIYGLIAVFTIFSFFDIFNGTLSINTPEFNKYSYLVSGIFITILAFIHLYKILKELQTENILTFPYFWLSASFLLYFSCTFYMYLFAKSMINETKVNPLILWQIDTVFSIIFTIMVSFVFKFSKNLGIINSNNIE
jgi:hypothetical protein